MKIKHTVSEAANNAGNPHCYCITREMIEKRAYELWQELGCPENKSDEIWLEAEAELYSIKDKTQRHPKLDCCKE